MKNFENLLLNKEMITKLVVYYIILISNEIKIVPMDLSKQQSHDAEPKAIQQNLILQET